VVGGVECEDVTNAAVQEQFIFHCFIVRNRLRVAAVDGQAESQERYAKSQTLPHGE